jgi:hypothetical protein
MHRSAQQLLGRLLTRANKGLDDSSILVAVQSHLRLLNNVIAPPVPAATIPPVVVSRNSPIRDPSNSSTTLTMTSPVVSKAPVRRFSIDTRPPSSTATTGGGAGSINGHHVNGPHSAHVRSTSSVVPTPDLVRSSSDGYPSNATNNGPLSSTSIHRSQSANIFPVPIHHTGATAIGSYHQQQRRYVPAPPNVPPPLPSTTEPSLPPPPDVPAVVVRSAPVAVPRSSTPLSASLNGRQSLATNDPLSPSTPPTVSTTSSLDLLRIRRMTSNNVNGSNSSPPRIVTTPSHAPLPSTSVPSPLLTSTGAPPSL